MKTLLVVHCTVSLTLDIPLSLSRADIILTWLVLSSMANTHDELQTLPEILASSAVDTPALSSQSAAPYVAHLTSLSLQDLEAEPTELASSSAQLTNALTTLCHTSYSTFLSLHATTSTLSSSLDSLSTSLSALLSTLPTLESSSRTFSHNSRALLSSRRKAALVLDHYDKLQDVLSLPILLETSVRNHSYADALLLAQHSTTLAARFPSNPLIQSVKADCDARIHSMLAQLLRVLHEQAKLPALFRAVSFIRKMEVFSEEELALAFLAGRSTYLDGALRAVDTEKRTLDGEASAQSQRESQARFLKRHVDAWREGVHDVVTQYTAVFLERPQGTGCVAPELHVLLTTFTTLQIRRLLDLLRETLPLVEDPSLLTSLLTQLTYCATSFARLGMDFRDALAPLFTAAVQQGITREFNDATDVWIGALDEDNVSAAVGTKTRPRSHIGTKRRKLSQTLLAPTAASAPSIPTESQLSAIASAGAHVPPSLLVSYPPIALYANGLLTALNGLRLLAPVSLLPVLQDALEGALTRGAVALLVCARATSQEQTDAEERGGTAAEDARQEARAVRAAGMVYVRVLVPFVRRALVEGVYGDRVDNPGLVLTDVLREWEEWLESADE